MKGVECREWNQEQIKEYVNTLEFVITIIDDSEDITIESLRKILIDCINVEKI